MGTMRTNLLVNAIALLLSVGVAAGKDKAENDLFGMSLEELMTLEVEDVVTTAPKRASLASEVPFSLTIVEPRGAFPALLQSLEDVDQRVSGLVTTSYNLVTPQLFIRGIGSNSSGAGDDPSVAYLVDGINIARPGAHGVPLFDLQRVEVIKGPQGALYGKGVIGGAVNILPNRPEMATSTTLSGAVFDRGFAVDSVDNAQLTDHLANRLSISWRDSDGYVTNHVTGRETGGGHDISLREQLAWHKGRRRAWLLLQHTDFSHADPACVYMGSAPAQAVGGAALAPWANHTDDVAMPWDGETELQASFASLMLEQQVDAGSWVSVTGVHRSSYEFAQNLMPVTRSAIANLGSEDSWQLSQEIRFEQEHDAVAWHVGAYLSREGVDRNEVFDFKELYNLLGFGWALTEERPGSADYDASNDVVNSAVFLNARWSLAPAWHLAIGLRHDYVRKEFDLDVSGGDPLDILVASGGDFSVEARRSWEETSSSLSLAHAVSDQLMLYASLTTGFKAGSFNSLSTSASSALASSEPERALSEELGCKGFFLGNRLQVNAAVFHVDYKDLQVFTQIESSANAPRAEISGLEWELRTKPMVGLELAAGYTYLDTEFLRFMSPSGVDLAGHDLLRAPEHAATFALDYSWITHRSHRYRWQLLASYIGDIFITPENTPGSRVEAHSVVDAALHWQPPASPVQYSVWVRNLANERYARHVIDQAAFLYTDAGSAWNLAPPRTVGISVGWQVR